MDLQDFLQQGSGTEEDKTLAWNLFQKAFDLQQKGQLDEAVKLYKQSIESSPSVSFLMFVASNTLSFLRRLISLTP